MTAVLRIVAAGLSVAVTVLLGRHIGPEGLGYFAYATSLIMLALVPISNGWGMLLMRKASVAFQNSDWAEAKTIAGHAWKGALAVAILGLIGGLVVLGVLDLDASFPIGFGTVLLLACVLFFDQLSAVRVSFIRAFQQPQLAQVSDIVAKQVLVILGVCLVIYFNPSGLRLADVFGVLLIASVLNYLLGRYLLHWISPPELSAAAPTRFDPKWPKAAAFLATGAGLFIINSQMGMVMLGFFASAEDLGLFRVATQISILSAMGYAALSFIAAPRFAAQVDSKDTALLQAQACFLARMSLILSLPVPLVFYFFGQVLIEVLLGPAFLGLIPAALVLCLAQSVLCAFGLGNSVLNMHGYERQVSRCAAFALIVHVIALLVLVPSNGILGAAIAYLISITIWGGGLWLMAYRKLGVNTSVFAWPKPA